MALFSHANHIESFKNDIIGDGLKYVKEDVSKKRNLKMISSLSF